MTLERSFQTLQHNQQRLHEALDVLRMTVVEDKPQQGDLALIDLFGDIIADLLDRLAGDMALVRKLPARQIDQSELSNAWQVLIRCQEEFGRLEYAFFGLGSHTRFTPLLHFCQCEGGEWLAWFSTIEAGLDQTQALLYEVRCNIDECWQEIGQRMSIHAVAVHNTAINFSPT